MKLKKKSGVKDLVKKSSSPKPFTNLREVMDYTRDFAMFYSGVEYEVYLDGCYDMGVRDFLMSYEYCRGKGAGQIKKHPDMHLFIDSGVFTYMSDPKYIEYTIKQWENQIHEYLDWARRHKDQIFGMAELDLQKLVGLDQVNEWRRKYFEPFMLETGIPVCFIYHGEGMEAWDKMCQRYPYVGFSSVSDEGTNRDLNSYKEMLRVAEKYNSLVHGFGMTRTSVLPELPFYTVDSTSWKSGFRYGQLAIWNGKKVQMFKKDDWDTKAIPFIRGYNDIQLDEKLLYEYYEPEILRANVYAYQKAEVFIIDRLKPLTYWKRAKVTKVDMDNLADDFFPTYEWFKEGAVGAKEYAVKMNINPDLDPQELSDLLFDAVAFVNWGDPKYEPMFANYIAENGALINELHDVYINRIVPDQETKIEDLTKFFTECVSGQSDKLLQLGTNFDRMVKERDDYIEDDEEELVDLTDYDIKDRLKNLLPVPEDAENGKAPELEELDREIFSKANIVPTFDEKGKFVKGQTAVRKPKKMYSKKYPKFACDTCYAAAKCPEFKAGYVCSYNKMFNRYDTRDMADLIQAMQGMVEHNLSRMQKAMVMEVLNGTIDGTVTSFIDQNTRLLQNLKQMYEYGSPEVLKQTKVVRADGSSETSTQITNPQSGGILEKLFGNMTTSVEEKKEEEFTEVEVVENKKKNPRYDTLEETEY